VVVPDYRLVLRRLADKWGKSMPKVVERVEGM
jgi:hypothetical protein